MLNGFILELDLSCSFSFFFTVKEKWRAWLFSKPKGKRSQEGEESKKFSKRRKLKTIVAFRFTEILACHFEFKSVNFMLKDSPPLLSLFGQRGISPEPSNVIRFERERVNNWLINCRATHLTLVISNEVILHRDMYIQYIRVRSGKSHGMIFRILPSKEDSRN